MNNARLLRLVVASPGDVQAERDAVETVVAELNRGIGDELGLRVEVQRWETDAFPAFHVEGAQGVIDSVLEIQDCDILVGIFWKRFGTPTAAAGSGTEHEIQIAREAWRQKGSPEVMLYFKRERYWTDSLAELEQWSRVLRFKELAAEWGLWWPYDEHSHFERLLRRQLTQVLRQLAKAPPKETPGHQPAPDSSELPDRNSYISRYRALIAECTREIVLCTSKLHKSEDRPEANEINTALQEARERGVDVQIIVADGYDRLPGAIELGRELGIAVRFDPGVHISDINYACFDRRVALVAARATTPPETIYRPSLAWVEFSSQALAATLVEDFRRRWRSPGTRSLGQCLRETLRRITLATSTGEVARHLAMPEAMIESYLKPAPATLFLLGRPGSGKTSVARAIQGTLEATGAPGPVMWFSDVTYLWRVFAESGRGDERVEPMEEGGFFVKDPALYKDALADLAERAKRERAGAALVLLEFSRSKYIEALQILTQNGIEPDLVVYLDVDLQTALLRNRQRALMGRDERHYVSEREMTTTYASDDLEQLKGALGGRLLVLREQDEPVEAVRRHAVQILERLKEV